MTALLVGLMGAAMVVGSDRVNIALLAALNLRYFVLYLFSLATDVPPRNNDDPPSPLSYPTS